MFSVYIISDFFNNCNSFFDFFEIFTLIFTFFCLLHILITKNNHSGDAYEDHSYKTAEDISSDVQAFGKIEKEKEDIKRKAPAIAEAFSIKLR